MPPQPHDQFGLHSPANRLFPKGVLPKMNITESVAGQRERSLLTGDYKTYHAQTTRRIHALRKRLGVATPRGRKFTPREAVTAEDVAKNVEFIQLLLTSSERAWTSAMAMKSAQSTEATQKPMPGSTKRQIVSRFKKATKYAENLVKVLADQDTTHSNKTAVLESRAYLSLLKGALYFEKSQWQACLHEYSLARLVYITIGSSTKTEVFKDLLSTTIDPSIRYAAYQLKIPRTKPVPHLAIEHFPADESYARREIESLNSRAFNVQEEEESKSTNELGASDLPLALSWRGRTVKLEDAAISQALGLAAAREQDLKSKARSYAEGTTAAEDFAAAYDDIIDARQEAVDATKAAISEMIAEGVDASDERMQSLQITRTAVNYAVIEWRVGRNRLLCGPSDGMLFESAQPKQKRKAERGGKARPPKDETTGRKLVRLRERVALYDAILQSIDAVKELPGVTRETEFVEELTGKRSYFQALRCLAIGRSHAAMSNLTEALALFARSLDLAKAGKASTERHSGPSKLELTTDQLSALSRYLLGLVSQFRGLVELKNISVKQRAGKGRWKAPLVERLDEYDNDVDLKNLVTYPPTLQPIPVKPLFFDLAWNYIEYPGRAPVAANGGAVDGVRSKTATGEKKETKKGWFGFGR